jgi:hypothetical protein
MRGGIVILIISGLIGVIIYCLVAQARMEREIEQLRIQIQEMHKPVPPALLDAKIKREPWIEKSSVPLCPRM